MFSYEILVNSHLKPTEKDKKKKGNLVSLTMEIRKRYTSHLESEPRSR